MLVLVSILSANVHCQRLIQNLRTADMSRFPTGCSAVRGRDAVRLSQNIKGPKSSDLKKIGSKGRTRAVNHRKIEAFQRNFKHNSAKLLVNPNQLSHGFSLALSLTLPGQRSVKLP
jgi:hypothetical protein